MAVKVDSHCGATYLSVAQHSFGTIAEGQYRDSFRANRYCGGKVVHRSVSGAFGHYVSSEPSVQDSGAVDTCHHTDTRSIGRMVNMGEIVDPRLRIIRDVAVDSVHNT